MLHAHCSLCGRPAGELAWRCGHCSGPFDLPAGDPGLAALPSPLLQRVSLGEGGTPVVRAGDDLPGVQVKLEYLAPTGSFKDRGAAVLIAAALARGSDRVVADSSGNAGSAIAAYSARAGLSCRVFVPEGTSPRKQAQIHAYGAQLELVPGDRTAAADAAVAAVESTGARYASHVWDPWFSEGVKGFVQELESEPDALLLPVGNGTLVLGAARGATELVAAGRWTRVPPLVALQAEGCAPLAEAFARGESDPVTVQVRPTAAEGVAIPHPPRGRQVLDAVRSSGGCIVTVAEEALAPAAADLARRGLYVEPTAALTWAGLLLARRHAAVQAVQAVQTIAGSEAAWRRANELLGGSVVVPACGSGLKIG